ncbi:MULTISPECIES: DUF6191 domain-containing protein [Streptomyces]|uniref:DUF6191 domain-containing protein n=1 Tax=Streptomyces TaxID=1883 RepID=UPI00166FB237|nr:DUF6191 domain-containing protein [Streptomyces ruber]
MFNAFEELFAPGHKHTSDERNRLETTREDVGDSDPGRGPIDLDSGTAVIRPPAARPHEEAGPDDPDGGGEGDRSED